MSQPSRYESRFAELRSAGEKAFIPFTLLGWPNAETCLETIRCMIRHRASALELGLAFSDPVADGPVIQQAAQEVIASGFRVTDALDLIRQVRAENDDIPIGLLVYYNLVLARGVERFFADVAQAGVDGVLIADLPPESSGEVTAAAQEHGISLIFIISPLTRPDRLETIRQSAGGFLYAVSRLGITGVEERYDEALEALIAQAGTMCGLPVCVGFGISTPEQAMAMIARGADGVVVGSRIIQLVQGAREGDVEVVLGPYLDSMAQATSQAACQP